MASVAGSGGYTQLGVTIAIGASGVVENDQYEPYPRMMYARTSLMTASDWSWGGSGSARLEFSYSTSHEEGTDLLSTVTPGIGAQDIAWVPASTVYLTPFADGRIHYYSLWIDYTSGMLRVYVDGCLMQEFAGVPPVAGAIEKLLLCSSNNSWDQLITGVYYYDALALYSSEASLLADLAPLRPAQCTVYIGSAVGTVYPDIFGIRYQVREPDDSPFVISGGPSPEFLKTRHMHRALGLGARFRGDSTYDSKLNLMGGEVPPLYAGANDPSLDITRAYLWSGTLSQNIEERSYVTDTRVPMGADPHSPIDIWRWRLSTFLASSVYRSFFYEMYNEPEGSPHYGFYVQGNGPSVFTSVPLSAYYSITQYPTAPATAAVDWRVGRTGVNYAVYFGAPFPMDILSIYFHPNYYENSGSAVWEYCTQVDGNGNPIAWSSLNTFATGSDVQSYLRNLGDSPATPRIVPQILNVDYPLTEGTGSINTQPLAGAAFYLHTRRTWSPTYYYYIDIITDAWVPCTIAGHYGYYIRVYTNDVRSVVYPICPKLIPSANYLNALYDYFSPIFTSFSVTGVASYGRALSSGRLRPFYKEGAQHPYFKGAGSYLWMDQQWKAVASWYAKYGRNVHFSEYNLSDVLHPEGPARKGEMALVRASLIVEATDQPNIRSSYDHSYSESLVYSPFVAGSLLVDETAWHHDTALPNANYHATKHLWNFARKFDQVLSGIEGHHLGLRASAFFASQTSECGVLLLNRFSTSMTVTVTGIPVMGVMTSHLWAHDRNLMDTDATRSPLMFSPWIRGVLTGDTLRVTMPPMSVATVLITPIPTLSEAPRSTVKPISGRKPISGKKGVV